MFLITIALDDSYKPLLNEVPELHNEIRRATAAMLTRFQTERRDKSCYMSGDTHNGALANAAIDCGSMDEPKKPMPDALQEHVAKYTKDDKNLNRNVEVERLLERK